jgi:hypothetical protein
MCNFTCLFIIRYLQYECIDNLDFARAKVRRRVPHIKCLHGRRNTMSRETFARELLVCRAVVKVDI